MDFNDVPMKVRQPAGTFSCQWALPDPNTGVVHRPHGEIDLRADENPVGRVFGEVPGNFTGEWPERFRYEYLHGELANGAGVLLINPVLSVIGPMSGMVKYPEGNGRIAATAALVGHGANVVNHSRVRAIKVQITGLEKISGLPPIASTQFPMDPSETPTSNWSVTTRRDGQTWSSDAVRLSILHSSVATVTADYNFSLRFTPLVKIELTEPSDVREAYERWVNPLYRVVSTLTGRGESVAYLEMQPAEEGESDFPFCQVFAGPISQSPYMPETRKFRVPQDSVLRLRQDGVSLLNLVEKWQTLEEEQNPLIHTFDPYALGVEQHPRARFLLLIQALEGMSNHEKRLEDRVIAFQEKRQRVINEAMKYLSGAYRKFAKNQFKKSPVSLDDRLRDMLASLPVDPTGRIGNVALVRRVCQEKGESEVGALRIIRNDLAHGNRTYDAYQLAEVAEALQSIVRAHVLRVLGLSPEIQGRILELT
ncbi:hypothetical protein IU486_09025 [Streptomyces gardneri]|nr:hypothetical protein [Streptomyces gardneri]